MLFCRREDFLLPLPFRTSMMLNYLNKEHSRTLSSAHHPPLETLLRKSLNPDDARRVTMYRSRAISHTNRISSTNCSHKAKNT